MSKLPNTPIAFLLHFLKKQKLTFAIILLLAFVWAVNESFFPYFIKLIVNGIANYRGAPSDVYTVLKTPLIVLAIFWLVMEFSMRLQGLIITLAFPKFRANIRKLVVAYVSQHSYEYFANNFAGNIANKISDLPASSERLVEILFFNIISLLVAFVVALGLMWSANYLFAVIMLAWFVAHMSVGLLFMSKGNKLAEIHSESVSNLSGKIVDSLTNMLTVRLFSRASYEAYYIEKYQEDEIEKSKKASLQLEKMKLFQGLAGLCLVFFMISTLIRGWIAGWVSIGDFSLVTMLFFSMLGMVWFMSYQITVFVREAGKIKAALALINVPFGITDIKDAKDLTISKGEIEFKNVCFTYQSAVTVFNNISVKINSGEKVGLVGLSGSGKSTFVNLLMRFYDINSGEILVDDHNIAKITRHSLRKNIAMIPQEPTLFHRTLMENIRYGRLNASDEEVLQASIKAHCHEFITQLNEGYDSLVGERGIKLSGGQRQRIAIARAILKNAHI